ncbi:MAG: acetylglutamate kinase [Clostridia bacterium]|nr:acetylglutamate kinase [Clostridia bacterium]MDE6605231.1 acetylglutamate kinase [Clostridia bacterium]MDE6870167.1 acetylglutamate kinase [Clostridia bacterium]
MDNISMQAETLVNALPYIQKYRDKIIVVKYGGNAMLNEELKKAVMNDIVLLSLVGVKVVLVHGGGPEINDMLKKVGKESKFINGLRYTDDETADIVQMVLAGKVNKDLVRLLSGVGGKAVGFCGIDGNIITAKKKVGEVDLGNVGDIKSIDVDPILVTLENDYIPVIATVAGGEDGKIYNINADTAAAAIASALHAENLVLMTDVRGLLLDKDDESTLISEIKVSEVPKLIKKGIISGGMIPKIDCVVEAVRQGVDQAVIIDGRIKHSIIMDMLTNKGIGTLIK